MKKIKTINWFEELVENILKKNKINYLVEGKNNQRLDFYVKEFDTYIECKRFPSDRTINQLNSEENVIIIQGLKSIEFINYLLNEKEKR